MVLPKNVSETVASGHPASNKASAGGDNTRPSLQALFLTLSHG